MNGNLLNKRQDAFEHQRLRKLNLRGASGLAGYLVVLLPLDACRGGVAVSLLGGHHAVCNEDALVYLFL